MAWVSPKVYAILCKSEEGKDIIERLPDMTQEECQSELDGFFGDGGKGSSSGGDYSQAKIDDEAEEAAYKAIGDEEVSEKEYEVTEDEIAEKLGDSSWEVGEDTTVGEYAKDIADKLGCSKEQVLKVIRHENPDIGEGEKMSKIMGFDDEGDNAKDIEKVEGDNGDNAVNKFNSYKEYMAGTAKKRWEDGSKYLNFDYDFDNVLEENGIDKENFLKVYDNVLGKSREGENEKIDLYEMTMRPIAAKLKNPKDKDIIGLGELEDGLEFYKEAAKKYGV